MLSPEAPALAIFGSILDDEVLSIAKTLAEFSGFAVMVRPVGDDPVSQFTGPFTMDESPPGMSSPMDSDSDEVEEGDEEEDSGEDEDDDGGSPQFEYASGTVTEGPALRLRGGRGDDSGEDDGNAPWTSKAHKAVVWLKLWPDKEHEYPLSLRTKTMVCPFPPCRYIHSTTLGRV